jgi:hypothetical protein
MCLILSQLTKNERQHAIALLILVFGLIFSHVLTALYLASFLIVAVIFLKFLSIRKKWVLRSYHNARIVVIGTLVILFVSLTARLTFASGNVLETFVIAGKSLLTGTGSAIVPETFFKVPFSARIALLALKYGADALIALMSCVGVIVLFVKFRHKNRETFEKFYTFLLCFVGAILALLAFQLLSNFSEPGHERFIFYAMVLSPFLVGLFLWHLSHFFHKYRLGSAIIVLFLTSCISVSLIQIFPFQSIAPRANVLSPKLPANEYIFDFRSVNTVYQENMIVFAERFSLNRTIVASDTVTRWQVNGFANDTFARRVIYNSSLLIQNLDWDLFLLHYDGKAGPLNEKVENRTSEALTELKYNLGNVVYDNGESFIIAK